MAFTIKVNGEAHTVDVDGDTPLLWALRDVPGVTGTKFGCGAGLCGACAVDCGLVVDPDTIAAQVEGGSIFGLTAVLHDAITLKDGRVERGNFDIYRPMRIAEVPGVETRLVRSGEAPGGIGEAPTCAVGPAATNAVFAATGKRVRTLPVDAGLLTA